jgi:hypothetical protein
MHAVIIVCCLCLSVAVAGTGPESFVGRWLATSAETYAIAMLKGGALYDVVFHGGDGERGVFVTGDIVRVDGELKGDVIYATSVQKDEMSGAAVVQQRVGAVAVTRIKTVTFSMSFCGLPRGPSPAALRAMWFTRPTSLQGMYNNCSNGRASFTPQDNIVIPRYVEIPCQGTYDGVPYDWSRCGSRELYALNHYASLAAREANISLDPNTRRILILPQNTKCSWVGLATVGCSAGVCTAWIRTPELATIMHELGHTMMLDHANIPGVEYRDTSCVMGFCCSTRCFNAPHGYILGWNDPVEDLTTTWDGTPRKIILPALRSKAASFVKYGDYFVSYRTAVGADVGLDAFYVNKISIHLRRNRDYSPTILLATLRVGEEWVRDISIRVVGTSPESAVVVFQAMRLPLPAPQLPPPSPPPSPPPLPPSSPPLSPPPLPPPLPPPPQRLKFTPTTRPPFPRPITRMYRPPYV